MAENERVVIFDDALSFTVWGEISEYVTRTSARPSGRQRLPRQSALLPALVRECL